ncbi:RING-H2 finger protein ATL54-like [Bidens hawaiensis]|uniref:RING-H2 finger protein ATL54-like n=1 Tax=Bidens hawaiensis TaxID=980011 RepID=UPI004049D7DF
MATYRLYRKVFEEPSNTTGLVDICSFDCDPFKNPTGNCLHVCSMICPSKCNTTDLYPPQPADGYNILTPPQHHHSSLSLPLKISIVILILTFSFFLLYTFYKFYTVWYRSRRRDRSAAPSRPGGDQDDQETHDEFLDHDVLDHPIWYIRTIGLQPSVISAITVVKYKKSDGLVDSASCSVCLSEFQDDETLRLLPKCNHAFHVPCIDTWLRSHTNCPLCRAGIVKNTNTTNSDDLGQTEDAHIAISIRDDDNEGEIPRENDNQNSDLAIRVMDEDENNKREIVGGSGTNDFIIMRRSVSLNDYEACRVRSDIQNNNNNYYSDRHNVQIQSVDGNLGFQVVKVDRAVNNRPVEHYL